MFEIKNVSKQFREETALRNISMNIGTGLNFIIGASGSGKTTLLKIISGMDQEFDGEVFYCGQNIKTMSEQEKSYFYNSIFGFVWQDFNLLDDLTVLENIMIPQYLKQGPNKKAAIKVLRELKIIELSSQKAGKLSGGQKQRVAIARELLKNPQVIIADEPTSALDEKASRAMMDILVDISKNRTVIIVTHDTTLINSGDKVYELDKGKLIGTAETAMAKVTPVKKQQQHKLSFKNACKLAVQNGKRKFGHFAAASLSLFAAATLLLVAVSGSITGSSKSAFQDLLATYGPSVLDISLVDSFTSAGSTDGQEKNEPNADVSQNIEGLYDRYRTDERVSHIVFTQAYQDICITVGGKKYKIEGSGSMPVVNELTAGKMPMGNSNEILVPQSFVKTLGLTDKEALGRTITFDANVYNWDTGEPIPMPVNVTAKIVGTADTTIQYDTPDGMAKYSVDDAFFFSQTALDQMQKQAKIAKSENSFTIRAKTPADMIAIKDELNKDGIVPLGRFELVEDMVRLGSQTAEQSSLAIAVIAVLALVVVLAVSLMTGLIRRREYAILKVSGYSRSQLAQITLSEFLLSTAVTGLLFLCISPLTNLVTTAFWKVNIMSGRLLASGELLIVAMGALFCTVTVLSAITTKISSHLMTGDR